MHTDEPPRATEPARLSKLPRFLLIAALALLTGQAAHGSIEFLAPHIRLRAQTWHAPRLDLEGWLRVLLGRAHPAFVAVRDNTPPNATVYYAIPAVPSMEQPATPWFMLLQPRLIGAVIGIEPKQFDAVVDAARDGDYLINANSSLQVDWSRFGTLVERGEHFSLWRAERAR